MTAELRRAWLLFVADALSRIARGWLRLGVRAMAWEPRHIGAVVLGPARWQERTYDLCVHEAAAFARSSVRARREAEKRAIR